MCWHKVTDETDINGLTLRDERVYMTELEIYKLAVDVCKHLDYNKIYKVMDLLEWEWYGVGVPTETDVFDTAVRLSVDAINCSLEASSGVGGISTGGLHAVAEMYEGEMTLKVSFILDEWDNYE